jgi:hypothetical protein
VRGEPGRRPVTVTARSLADYRDMFALDDSVLTAGPILDCPGGASSFGAEVRSRGGQVVSVDPACRLGAGRIAERVRLNLRDAEQIFATSAVPVDWDYLGSVQAYVRASQAAAGQFHADFARHRRWYLAAALPRLPFADSSFPLALTSHLLFVYDAHFSFSDHLAALMELVRVSPAEVRVHPIVESNGAPYARLDDLRGALKQLDVATGIQPVRRTWITGAAQMLICRKLPVPRQ